MNSRCYKCVILMFSDALCNSLPPCTLQLIDSLLQSPFVSQEIFTELIDDLSILNRNCWRILTREKVYQNTDEDKTTGMDLQSLFYPLLTIVCRECKQNNPALCIEALQLLHVLNISLLLIE